MKFSTLVEHCEDMEARSPEAAFRMLPPSMITEIGDYFETNFWDNVEEWKEEHDCNFDYDADCIWSFVNEFDHRSLLDAMSKAYDNAERIDPDVVRKQAIDGIKELGILS